MPSLQSALICYPDRAKYVPNYSCNNRPDRAKCVADYSCNNRHPSEPPSPPASSAVTPAKAGVYPIDSSLRWNDRGNPSLQPQPRHSSPNRITPATTPSPQRRLGSTPKIPASAGMTEVTPSLQPQPRHPSEGWGLTQRFQPPLE
jgi:hypothetical protein